MTGAVETGFCLEIPDSRLDIGTTLDCGQAFRWQPHPQLSGQWVGAAGNHAATMIMRDGRLYLEADRQEADFWRRYLDLDRDYDEIYKVLCRDATLAAVISDQTGIRILRQDPWEAVCSFIISANNNIPRIRGIIERLCAGWGADLGGGHFGFPSAEVMAGLTPEELAPLRAGYRTAYLLTAARQAASGEVNLTGLEALPTPELIAALQQLQGVGPKVAACVALFGYHRLECVPVDVWVKRLMERLYPGGWPGEIQPWAGVAQQVLFHHIRQNPDFGL